MIYLDNNEKLQEVKMHDIDGVTFTNAEMKACKEVVRNVINKSMEEYVNSLTQAEKERQSSQGYFTEEQEGVVQSASNKELSSTIKNLFQNVDMKDEKALHFVMKQYKEFMTPAYLANGLRNMANNNSLMNVLDQDISGFVKEIANANAVIDNVGSTFNDTI